MISEYHKIEKTTYSFSSNIESVIATDDLIDFGIGCLLFCCVCFSHNAIASIASLLFMAVFMLHLLLVQIDFYFKFLHFIFGGTAAIVGCTVIEFYTLDLYEIDTQSYYAGALPLLVFSYWVFMMTIKIYNRSFKKKKREINNNVVTKKRIDSNLREIKIKKSVYLWSIVGFALICFIFAKVFDNPSFVLGIDRFEYDQLFDYGRLYDIALKLIKYLIIPCIVIAIYYKSKLGWTALAIYCLYAFWVGNKFGIFFSLLCCITMIYSEKITERIERVGDNKQSIALIIIAVVVLIGTALFAVSFTTQVNLLEYFSSRIAQQGQLWWKTYALSNSWHVKDFHNEISAVMESARGISDNVGARHGIYNIMYYTSPKSIIDAKLATGSRYTEAGFAAAYYYFGIPGTTLFAVVGGLLAGVSVNLLLSYLQMNQFIRAFLCLRLYFMTADMMSNFLFAGFFSIVSIITYLLLIFGKDYIVRYSS